MEFFGQTKLLKEVAALENEIRRGKFLNLLLIAPSGYGKTTLALKIIKETVGLKNACLCGPPDFYVEGNKRIVFVDEVHILDPQEALYQYLDYGAPTFILATNELGLLKEPMINRCIPLIFEDYILDDIMNIVRSNLLKLNLNESIITSIAQKCKLNPRVARILCTRLSYLFDTYGVPQTVEVLDVLVENILSITKDGLNSMDRKYLQVLKSMGGRASLTTLANTLHLTKNTLIYDVEPDLLRMNLISISSRGRELA